MSEDNQQQGDLNGKGEKGEHAMDVEVTNPGNPVFSCDARLTRSVSAAVSAPKTKEPMSGHQHPMYVTSSSSYGGLEATTETIPRNYHGRSQRFSEHLGECGMYRNHALNTAMDHSRV